MQGGPERESALAHRPFLVLCWLSSAAITGQAVGQLERFLQHLKKYVILRLATKLGRVNQAINLMTFPASILVALIQTFNNQSGPFACVIQQSFATYTQYYSTAGCDACGDCPRSHAGPPGSRLGAGTPQRAWRRASASPPAARGSDKCPRFGGAPGEGSGEHGRGPGGSPARHVKKKVEPDSRQVNEGELGRREYQRKMDCSRLMLARGGLN